MRYYHNYIQNYRGGAKLFVLLLAFLLVGGAATAQVTIGGSVYGGGNKAAGTVTGTTKVEVEAGTVAKSVYGGGNQAVVTGSTSVTIDGDGTVNDDVYGGGNNAAVTGTTNVTLDGGTVDKNVFGGGNNAGVLAQTNVSGTGTAAVTINGGTVGANATANAYGVYGGCNNQGAVSGAVTVNINGGTLGTEDKPLKGIFGGGYGSKTTTGSDVTVTIGDLTGNNVPTLYSDIYGGSALGSVNANANQTTKVDFLNGTLHGNLYGGGLGKANVVDGEGIVTTNNADSGIVKGNVLVNIGAENQLADNCHITLSECSIYGCNNTNGSPQGNVDVNIYKTAHTGKNFADYQQSDATYAIANVFGGGHQAHYLPLATDNRAQVTVYSCDNTIGRVFGGGDAADAHSVGVEIYGGRFNQVFGGGNGEVAGTAANVGNGGTNTQVHGGYINQLFGGSNKRGTISGTMITEVDRSGGCPEKIFEFFGGSNEAPITGNITTTIACGDAVFENVYGGSNLADITGNVTLHIQGGIIANVFGGSKGVSGQETAKINGDVNVNLTGGTIGYVYGGNNEGGYATGVITVTIDSTQENCPLTIEGNVYGGGNVAPAYASSRTKLSPVVNIKHGTVGRDITAAEDNEYKALATNEAKEAWMTDWKATHGNVFAGGHGQGSHTCSNPIVYMGNGDYTADTTRPVVKGNIYGGGEASRVFGNTKVDIQQGTVKGNVFAGSKGKTLEELAGDGEALTRAIVDGWTTLAMSGGTVEGNLFGGCENAMVGHHSSLANISNPEWSLYNNPSATNKNKYGDSYLTLSGGTVNGSVFGGGMGYAANVDAGRMLGNARVEMTAGLVKGNIYGGGMMGSVGTYTDAVCAAGTGAGTVTVSGGTVGVETAGQELTLPGNVYGGGLGIASGTNHADLGNVNSTSVSISGDAYVVNSVYGGGDNGHVMADAAVNVTGGTIGKKLTLAERKVDENGQLTRVRTGNVYGGGNGATQIGSQNNPESGNPMPQYNGTAGRVYGNTQVTVSGGTVRHNVYGGGNMASVGVFTINSDGTADYSSGGTATVAISGEALIGPKKSDLVEGFETAEIDTNFKYLGANEGSVFGSSRGLSGGFLKNMSFAKSTSVTVSGTAQVVGNVFGGGENGHVQNTTEVNITGGTIGGIPLHGTEYAIPGDHQYYSGVTVHLSDADDENAEDLYGAGRRIFRGNVFGGGKGSDFIAWFKDDNSAKNYTGYNKYCYTAGRVYGNTNVTIGGTAMVYNKVYGGGSIASVGTFTYVKDAQNSDTREVNGIVSGTGTTTVTINGGTIGSNGRNNGDVFGAGRGLPGAADSRLAKDVQQLPDEAYVGNSYVVVNGGHVTGSVYGGSANGHVQGDAHVTVNEIDPTNNPTIIGTSNLGGWHSNVYGGGGGTNRYAMANGKLHHSITSGRVFGDTYVTINGGTIRHSVYGGGALASVGTYNISATSEPLLSGGTATVLITGGTIGTDGDENGMVFGSGRGEKDAIGAFMDSLTYVGFANVTIGNEGGDNTSLRVKGSVYGSGENGHVYKNATVNIKSGTIGCTANEYASFSDEYKNNKFPYRGNVYGAGCGTDQFMGVVKDLNGDVVKSKVHPTEDSVALQYNPMAGIVQGTTEVNVSGGYISHNVYGAGAMASVGLITGTTYHTDPTTSFALSWPAELTYTDIVENGGTATVNITGGHIGTAAAPEGASGDVYGSARGDAGDRYQFANLANVRTAAVTVDFTPSDKNVIVGSVYGSGENGHVYDNTLVTLNNGLINGSLFGGGKGTDKYTDQLKNPSTDALYDAEVYDITAGKVYGNTRVVMNGGRVAKNVYGGGNTASVGKGNYRGYGEGANVPAADILLAENSGHCSVNIHGGTIGPDTLSNGTAYNGDYVVADGYVFGAGKGIVFPDAAKVGFDYDRNYYVAYVNKASVFIGDSTQQRSCDYKAVPYPHVTASVFGGGENGHVRFDSYVQTNRGTVGVRPLSNITSEVGHWADRGNIFGAGKGEDLHSGGGYCQSAGSVTRNTTIDILGARIYRNVQGGGSMASVGPVKGYTGESSTCVINVRLPLDGDTLGGPSYIKHAFGGYVGGGSRGIPSPDGTDNSNLATCHNSQINIYRGRIKNTLYGGGENGQMLGNTEINVYGGFVRSAIYGGGKGCWKTTADDAGIPGTYNNDTLSGYIAGNTTVNLLGGIVPFTYGGCRRANVGGNATINIGKDNGDGTYSGDVVFASGKNKVYGGNQYAGSPKGDITVNVYKTNHDASNSYPSEVLDSTSLMLNDATQQYAIGAVYGGSFNSSYLPAGSGHTATVHVYGCENTIQEIYGGAEAADMGAANGVTVTTQLIIDGGRFKRVFGGGNGYSETGNRDKPYKDANNQCSTTPTATMCLDYNPGANIYGTARTIIHSGLITEFFGGSNQLGDITTISTQIDHSNTGCAEVIGNLYSGSNESVISGNGELIIACGAGEFKEVYGGSNNASIDGDVTLTIRGGTIGNVYAGSRGTETNPADINGNVTLNLEGGTITNAFGGSNIKGAISGIITVNVLDTCQDCPLTVHNVYGGGNYAPYTPTNPSVPSPLVNIKHTKTANTLTGSVYGGGYGPTAIVTANPVVTIGDSDPVHTALVGTDVFGGGSFAEVIGNTSVQIQNANTRISGDVYGGGALADVKGTSVTLDNGIVSGNIYGGGLGRNANGTISAIAAVADGDVQVTVNGGRAANIYGANNINGAPTGAVKVDIYGTDLPTSGYALDNVFGGGNHAAYDGIPQVTIHNCDNKIEYVYGGGNAASVKGTNVVVYGGDTIGNVFGGCYGADVTQNGTLVDIHGGTIGSVFGGNNESGTITGPINVIVNKEKEAGTTADCEMHISRLYGGGNLAASSAGNISIVCTGGDTEGIDTVFGGAHRANIAGKIELDIEGGRIGNLFGGNNLGGNISDSITINVNWGNGCSSNYLGNIYGAGNLAQYNPDDSTTINSPVINLINGTVSGNVYGGGLGDEKDTKNGLVNSNPIINIGDTAASYSGTVLVGGNVLGGGSLAQVKGNTLVNLFTGTVDSSLFGGGEGLETNPVYALVMKNATVKLFGGRVKGSVYGGGRVASVGYYNTYDGASLPTSCNAGTGHTAVFISGGTVGPDVLTMPAFTGHVFGGGKGKVADPVSNPAIANLAYSNTTEVVVSGSAFIKGSVYGGSESGHVFDSTFVKIQGGQIGAGFNYATNTNYDPYTDWNVASLAECHHWPFTTSNLAYDPYDDKYDSKGGAKNATDGHTYYGNVFGGGSGVFPYQPVNRTDTAVWSRTAGAVYGNTRVEVTGGHILTSLYGGNEMTDVGTYNTDGTRIKGGTASVIMTGGTLGVPRTFDSITAHPVTCYLFGAGKGDPRIFFNTRTNVDSVYIRIAAVKGKVAPRIYGSVFGGGEDGHVLRHVSLNIDSGAYIGTLGTTYVDGNVFGAGRGFSGEALTAGTVGGNVEVNIKGGTMLGNVYGGGRLASVGTLFTYANNPNYGKMQEGNDHGYITINISGDAIIGTEAAFGDTRPTHLVSGNVYGGSMGRLTLINGNTNTIWPDMAKVKHTEINISGNAVIRASVFGGSELGSVTGNTKVNITSSKVKIGTVKRNDNGDEIYSFGSVFGGGYGTSVTDVIGGIPSNRLAGRVYGNTEVNINEGFVANCVYGGGKMAYVGDKDVATSGNTLINIGNATQSSNSVVIGGNIYGANDEAGSPLGNTEVHIYRTAHTDANAYPSPAPANANELATNMTIQQYALTAVYGGGNLAPHTPTDTVNGTTLVHVHHCDNTIKDIFGGGDAAATRNNHVIIEGGRIHRLFGGGNGEVDTANVLGTAVTEVRGGLIDSVFGGSNVNGTIGSAALSLSEGTCDNIIGTLFGGGNLAPGGGGLLTIECGDYEINEIYGGSNKAPINGDVTLTVKGGIYNYVYAGSKGAIDNPATQKNESFDAYIDGNVTLNLHGGTIANAFGGSNLNGNVTGVITVNVLDTMNNNCPLYITNLYGGSNEAVYQPDDATIVSPIVNICNIRSDTSIAGNVFGAGKGLESIEYYSDGRNKRENADKGGCYSNPQVNIGDTYSGHSARVSGSVYGGGEMAEVHGSTTVNMQKSNSLVRGNLFGAGKGFVGDSISANVSGDATISITGGKVDRNVYGGGELSSVGTFGTTANGYDIVSGGKTTVTVTGGHIGKDDFDHATSDRANGNVYGAGLGRAGSTVVDGRTFHFDKYNYVKNSEVTIGGNAVVRGSVFGGAENGHVWNDAIVKIKDGEIGTELTAQEEQEGDDGSGRNIFTGNVYGGGRGIDEIDDQHHHSITAGRVFGNTYVEVSGGLIHHNVYGGGSLASIGDTIHDVTNGVAHDIMGNVIEGNYKLDTLGGTITRAYKAGDPVTGTGIAHVRICGGRIGHTGHNEGSVFGSGRGMAGDNAHTDYFHMAFAHNTYVYIKDTTIEGVGHRYADVRGSVFGGGANGHVTQNAYVNMSSGVVGGKFASDYTAAELAVHPLPANPDYVIDGKGYYPGNYYMDTLTDHWGRIPDGHHTFLGNVYAGGRGVDHNAFTGQHSQSRFAGRVFGNAKVEVSGGLVYHSVYGGGSLASVGEYDTNATGDITNGRQGTGKTIVVVSGGRIGTSGRNNGRVFGASRGMSGSEYNHFSFVNNTDVTVSGTAEVRGCVFGGGEDGHVLDSTLVKIQGGTIGSGKRTDLPWGNEYIGNVYGGGRGVDLNADHRPSNTAGWVRGSTHVLVSGGHIHHNVYGGGSLASVGLDGTTALNTTYGINDRPGRAWVEVTGGTIGIYAAPVWNSSTEEYEPNPNALYGSVYGAGRGRAGIGIAYGNDWTRYTYVSNTKVIINYETIDNNNYITGNVFGGGNNGHVNNSTYVTVTRGLIGSDGDKGFGSTEGNVFGGGRGEETYEAFRRNTDGNYCTASGVAVTFDSTIAATAADTLAFLHRKTLNPAQENHVTLGIAVDELLSPSAGWVFGNTNVNINGATKDDVLILHSIYGGGALSSVGDFEFSADTVKYTANTGKTTVLVSGGTIGAETLYNGSDAPTPLSAASDIAAYYNDNEPACTDAGHVYGGGMGKADNTFNTFNNVFETDVDITSANAVIHGSVYGGSANGHVIGSTDVTVSAGTIGTHGISAWDGYVFGGGEGSGTVTGTAGNEVFTLHPTCGRVGRNTHVSITGGTLKGSVYGGGRLALTGVDVNGSYSSYVTGGNYDSVCHGFAYVNISGGTIGSDNGVALEASDYSVGDIFGSGRGDVDYYQSVLAGRVANTSIIVSGTPTVHGAVFGGGEMAGIGYWSDADGHPFAGNTGTSLVDISGGTIGTPYEFTAAYLVKAGVPDAGAWTVITPDGQGGGRLTHSCTGNVVGGSQGDVDLTAPAFISMGRSRQTYVDISGTPVIMGNVYGGAEQGVVTGNTHVKVRGGTIGTLVPEFKVDADGNLATTNDITTYKTHYFGSVFGGGYGSERWWDRDPDDNTVKYYNDSCLFSSDDHSAATLTHYTSATQIAGRVYGNTYVTVSGGTIYENVYGGGNMASVGYIEPDANGNEELYDSTAWRNGVCNVTITGDAFIGGNGILGPLDGTELNAEVYGAGKGVGNDPDERFKRYCNVVSTNLTVNGGRVNGSTFGGGADCHVLRHTHTLVQAGAIIGSGQIDASDLDDGYSGYEQEYDGCVIGGGRNALNVNHTAGRVQGHSYVTVEGGRILRSVIGGGALARIGVDTNGLVADFTGDNNVYDSLHHGSTYIYVTGTTESVSNAAFEASDDYAVFSGTTYADENTPGNIILSRTTIGAPNGPILVDNDYTIGDIFGGGKGDTKDTVDFMAGRVMNTHVRVTGSPRIMADIYAGGEMSSIGWWDTNKYVGTYGSGAENSNHDVYYTNTGYTKVTITGTPYTGTPYEFSTANYIDNRKAWTLVDGLGRLTHTCSGNVYGGGQGYVEEDATHRWNWVHMGRVRYTTVDISDGRFMGNVFGGGSRGVVKEDCNVTITGGRIGCVIQDNSIDDTGADKYDNQRYFYGSVFGGGYGNPKTFLHWNDSCFIAGNGDSIKMIPTEQAGRVYGNTHVNISGGQIMDCVYGGGDMASTGWVERDPATGAYLFADSTRRHGGVCYVSITESAIVGPIDGNGHNAYVFGAGKGVSYDPDEIYKNCANVNRTHLTVDLGNEGRIWGSLFGGGADCHVLGDVHTTLHAGTIGTRGVTSFDGNIFGAGRNYQNTNHTNGRVQGNVYVLMDGGILKGSIFGGGRMALTGINVNGNFPTTDWPVAEHGNVDIQVRAGAVVGTDQGDSLLMANESCGDIFGAGKGDTKNHEDIWSGRVTNTTITVKDSLGSSPRIYGGVFGGGEMASIGWWDDTIKNGSTVVFYTNGDNNDAHGVFYSGTGISEVNISSTSGNLLVGTDLEYTVDPASNPGDWTIYNSAKDTLIHTCTGCVYGGCQGDVDPSSPRWVSMGRSASAVVNISGGRFMGNVYGGAEQGIVTGDTRVNISGGTFGIDGLGITPHSSLAKYYSGDVYAAGYGCDEEDEWDNTATNDSTAGSTALDIGWTPGLLAGRTFGNARADILGGHILGSVYGGGSFASVGDDKPGYTVNGNATVNIGDASQVGHIDQGPTIDGDVFGANNFKGTPYGNTQVNVYHTAHTATNTHLPIASVKALTEPASELSQSDVDAMDTTSAYFALQHVYGGGNLAAHTPMADDGVAEVHIYYCEENTVRTVYGGGNAANTKNNLITIDGGRIYQVFGGGNGAGASNPGANVTGTATTRINGGLINALFGGSNAKGTIGNIDLSISKEGTCDLMVATTFGGGNEADGGGGVVSVGCGTKVGSFYGGSRNANIVGDLVLNIVGGTFERVFGGSQGTVDKAANIDGNVTVNVTGGHIQSVFGGSDVNGNITGKITVNVDLDPNYDCPDGLLIDNVYGGSNMALYQPDAGATLASPEVNIISDSVAPTATKGALTFNLKNVYGGGLGNGTIHSTGTYLTGYAKASPVVNIGGIDKVWNPATKTLKDTVDGSDNLVNRRNIAIVHDNVFGGGSAAPVEGNPTVILYSQRGSHTKDWDTTVVQGTVFGGGYGPTAKVDGNTTVGIFGDATVVEGNVYGGGNAGILTGSTDVQVGFDRVFTASQPTVTVDANKNVTLYSSTPDATIYYTTDGSAPTSASTPYTAPFPGVTGQTIRAIAVKAGYETSLPSNSTSIP